MRFFLDTPNINEIRGSALWACDLARVIFAFRGPYPVSGTAEAIGRFAVWHRGHDVSPPARG